ncbi:unnamed protein product, partial [marine sediment metagenome]
ETKYFLKQNSKFSFNVELNKWNGMENIQLNIKDIKTIF